MRTAILEARYVWGDEALYDLGRGALLEGGGRRQGRAASSRRSSTSATQAHKRLGDSRYVVEPNVKEGKGGLRDLHALFWIGKYAHRVRGVAELVEAGLLSPAELRQFQRAERFLWAVRCHLHIWSPAAPRNG